MIDNRSGAPGVMPAQDPAEHKVSDDDPTVTEAAHDAVHTAEEVAHDDTHKAKEVNYGGAHGAKEVAHGVGEKVDKTG